MFETQDPKNDKIMTAVEGEIREILSSHAKGNTAGDATTLTDTSYEAMCKSIRSSGKWLLAWAVFSFFQPNQSWALLLVTIALMSFYFYDVSAMFLVYTWIIFYAAVLNLISGEPIWVFMAVTQVAFGIFSFRQYRIYRTAKANEDADSPSDRHSLQSPTDRGIQLAWFAMLLGGIGVIGICSLFLIGVIQYFRPELPLEGATETGFGAAMELSILGLPVGIAALCNSRRYWGAAVAGSVMGGATLLLLVATLFLA